MTYSIVIFGWDPMHVMRVPKHLWRTSTWNVRSEHYSGNICALSLHSIHFLYPMGEVVTEFIGSKHHPMHIKQKQNIYRKILSDQPFSLALLRLLLSCGKHTGFGTSLCSWKTWHFRTLVLITTICPDTLADRGKGEMVNRVSTLNK